MHAISNLCDRVVVLDHGKTLFDGKPINGIALYTKLMHDERFGETTRKDDTVEAIPEQINRKATTRQSDFDEWFPVPNDKRGGAGNVDILRVSVTKNGQLFKTVQQGETLVIRILVYAKRVINEVIFGYTIKDRVGVAVFGENSLCLSTKTRNLEAGYALIEYSFFFSYHLCQQSSDHICSILSKYAIEISAGGLSVFTLNIAAYFPLTFWGNNAIAFALKGVTKYFSSTSLKSFVIATATFIPSALWG